MKVVRELPVERVFNYLSEPGIVVQAPLEYRILGLKFDGANFKMEASLVTVLTYKGEPSGRDFFVFSLSCESKPNKLSAVSEIVHSMDVTVPSDNFQGLMTYMKDGLPTCLVTHFLFGPKVLAVENELEHMIEKIGSALELLEPTILSDQQKRESLLPKKK